MGGMGGLSQSAASTCSHNTCQETGSQLQPSTPSLHPVLLCPSYGRQYAIELVVEGTLRRQLTLHSVPAQQQVSNLTRQCWVALVVGLSVSRLA